MGTSYILRRKEGVYQKACNYLRTHKRFLISCITYYECLRGYKAIRATKRLQTFQDLLHISTIFYLDQPVLEKAGEIYGVLKQKGALPGEFDILIGATAMMNDLTLVTNNERHYRSLEQDIDLRLSNWTTT